MHEDHMTGTLYLVSTPIGNINDITIRAIEILNSVDIILTEDTRVTSKLLKHHSVKTQSSLQSFNQINEDKKAPKIISELEEGKCIALVSDAGTPGISDPAYRLIRAAIDSNFLVQSIPGPSAFLTALVCSGLPTDRFIFEGFLPHKKGRKGKLEKIKDIDATVIYYESPNRIKKTLNDILKYVGDRPAVICRELSKKFEEIFRGKVSELLNNFNNVKAKGEFVIMIAKDDKNVYF